MKHILSILVNDKPGVVSRVSALFTKRTYNIDSLITCSTDREGTTDLIIVVDGEDVIIDQISKQLTSSFNSMAA
jgi:acetolactate synthase-1/3 small subunit